MAYQKTIPNWLQNIQCGVYHSSQWRQVRRNGTNCFLWFSWNRQEKVSNHWQKSTTQIWWNSLLTRWYQKTIPRPYQWNWSTFSAGPYYIHTDPTVPPKHTTPRPVSVHKPDTFVQELNKMLNFGIVVTFDKATLGISFFMIIDP